MTRTTKTSKHTAHEIFCAENADHFVAVRGSKPSNRIRREFPSIGAARAFAAAFGDGRTMIYAVTALGHSAHLENA